LFSDAQASMCTISSRHELVLIAGTTR